MKLKVAGLCLSLSICGSAWAATTLTTPEEVVLLSVNNQEVKSGLFKSKKQYQIPAGRNNLNIRYSQYFELPLKHHEIVKSGVISLETPDLKDNQTYKLIVVNLPKEVDEAKEFVKNPQFAVVDQNNQVVGKSVINDIAQNSILGESLGRIFDQDDRPTKVINLNNGTSNSSATNQTTNTSVQAVTSKTVISSGADQKLIDVWKQASKAERQKFMSWLAEQ